MTENITTPKVTIDQLAVMIAKGFKETNGNINKLEVRFDGLEQRFDTLENRVGNIEDTMATKDDVKHLEHRFDEFEKTVLSNHGHRLRKIETKLQLA